MAQSIQKNLKIITEWFEEHSPETMKGLNPPTTPDEVERLESLLGFPLPQSFKEFLYIYNGETWDSLCLLGDFNRLLSCNEIADKYLLDQELAKSIDGPEHSSTAFWKDRVLKQIIFVKGSVKPILNHPNWVPFSCMNGDVYRYIDFDPAPNGIIGQIIEVDPECCTYEVLADSFDDFLARYAQQLIEGQFEFNDEYGSVVFKGEKNILQWEIPEWIKNL